MGSKYTSQSASGYNSSPPVDDGSSTEANKVKWSTIKTKLTDTLKTLAEGINTALVTALDKSCRAVAVNDSAGASDHDRTIQVNTSSVTISLADAATMAAGYTVSVANQSNGTISVGLAASTDTLDGGTNVTQTINAKETRRYIVNATATGYLTASTGTAPLPRAYLAGCALSNNGSDATNDIDIAVGECRDSTHLANINVAAMTKRLDAGWSAGTGNGMRNSAAAITDATYFIYAVRTAAGVQDIYAHTSATVATVLTALQAETGGSGYIYARRIGAILRASGAILPFTQIGDDFYLTTAVSNSTSNPGTTDTAFTLTVPIGLRVKPYFHINTAGVSNTMAMSIRTPDIGPTEAPGNADGNANWAITANGTNVTRFNVSQHDIYTNTSGQVNLDLSATSSAAFEVKSYGWRDRRGRDD
jgi:hypothetical protein